MEYAGNLYTLGTIQGAAFWTGAISAVAAAAGSGIVTEADGLGHLRHFGDQRNVIQIQDTAAIGIRRPEFFCGGVVGGKHDIFPAGTDLAAEDWVVGTRRAGFRLEQLWDPRINIEAGAWYLARALRRWEHADDPIPFALAEYNARQDLELDTHSGPEAQVAALSDDIAYNNHDLHDGLRAGLFTTLLAQRVADRSWNRVLAGDACALHGTRSLFTCEQPDADIEARCRAHDLHPALPLWGSGEPIASGERHREQYAAFGEDSAIADALEALGLSLSYRPARLFPDDFCWEFCDDGRLKLGFSLGAGSYATAVVAELVDFSEGDAGSGDSGE